MFNPVNFMIKQYNEQLLEGKENDQIRVGVPANYSNEEKEDDDIIVLKVIKNNVDVTRNPLSNMKSIEKKAKPRCTLHQVNTSNEEIAFSDSTSDDDSNHENTSNDKVFFGGRIIYDPITINGKEITISNIIKWSRKYNRFNNFKCKKIKRIFARSHELCYNDNFDYKFFGLTDTNEIIVFTRSQVTLSEFFPPAFDFFKKYPLNEDDPPY